MMIAQEIGIVSSAPQQYDVEIIIKIAAGQAESGEYLARFASDMAKLGVLIEQSGSLLPGGYAAARAPRDLADRVIDRIRQCEGVEAAFIKPAGETASEEAIHG